MAKAKAELWFYLAASILGALGAALVWYSTIWGAGLISDSFQYVSAGRNFVAGEGFGYSVGEGVHPLVHYPPLFAAVLGGFEFFGVDALVGARLSNAALYGLNIVLIGVSVRKISGSDWFGLYGALAAATSAVLLEVHSWALSEPLFIFLGLVSFLLLAEYAGTGGRKPLVIGAGVVGLAFLTRYAGVALAATALLGTVLMSRARGRRMVEDAIVLGTLSLAPIALWAARIWVVAGDFGAREWQYLPLTAGNVRSGLNSIFTWLIPFPIVDGREFVVLSGATALLLAWAALRFYARFSERGSVEMPESELFRFHGLYLLLYPLVVVLAKVFLDRGIGFNDRMLSPMLASLFVLGVGAAASVWRRSSNKLLRAALLGGGTLLLLFYAMETSLFVREFRTNGIGLARAEWHRAESIQRLETLGPEPIYSNSVSTVYLWSGRPARNLNAFGRLAEGSAPEAATLVVFKFVPRDKNLDEWAERLKLVVEDEEAAIYYFVP